jgi:glycerol kinase
MGITPGTGRNELVRAALESMAYSYRDVIDAMQNESGVQLPNLKVDGGAVANNFMLQFQADQLNVPVIRPSVTESTARGAAFLAGLASGFWKSQLDLRDSVEVDREFSPSMPDDTRETLYNGWKKAVARSLDWVDH